MTIVAVMSRTTWVSLALTVATAGLIATATPRQGFAVEGAEVTILAGAIDPAVARVPMSEPVVFVNRSGRIVHVEFLGPAGGHHVFQVPGSIKAEFHRPGEHPYVVHFESGPRTEVRGLVTVSGERRQNAPLSECTGFTVEETCIAR